jgi:hypothetical protein
MPVAAAGAEAPRGQKLRSEKKRWPRKAGQCVGVGGLPSQSSL